MTWRSCLNPISRNLSFRLRLYTGANICTLPLYKRRVNRGAGNFMCIRPVGRVPSAHLGRRGPIGLRVRVGFRRDFGDFRFIRVFALSRFFGADCQSSKNSSCRRDLPAPRLGDGLRMCWPTYRRSPFRHRAWGRTTTTGALLFPGISEHRLATLRCVIICARTAFWRKGRLAVSERPDSAPSTAIASH